MCRELIVQFFWIIVLVSLWVTTGTEQICPNHCSCDHSQSGIRIVCETTRMPDIIPDNTTYVEVRIKSLHHDHIRFGHHSWKDVKTLLITNINYYAGLNIINEKSFSGLAALEELHISEMKNVVTIPSGTFAHLRKLKVLDLSNNNKLLLNGLSSVFPDLVNMSLDLLNLSRTNNFILGWHSTHLDKQFIVNLAKLKIKSSDLSLTGRFLINVPIKTLNKYFRFPNLEVLNISRSTPSLVMSPDRHPSRFLQSLLDVNLLFPALKHLDAQKLGGIHIDQKYSPECVLNITNYPFDELCAKIPAENHTYFPPSLESLNLDGTFLGLLCAETRPRLAICINNNNKLTRVSIRNSAITGWNMAIISLIGLHTLDLRHNRISVVTSTGLRYWPNLKQLLLGWNHLWKYQRNVSFETVLNYSTELEEIDLSNNNLSLIPRLLFTKNTKLQKIDLSHNHLNALAIDIKQLTHLKILDLTQNALSAITDFCLVDIGLLTSSRDYPFIDLTNNNIMCSCQTKAFIKSLSEISRSLISFSTYTCSYKDRIVNIRSINERTLNNDCILESLTLVSIVLCVIMTIGLVSVITYRCRIQLFKLYIIYRFWKYRNKKLDVEDRIFLVYSHYDRELVLGQIYPQLNSRLQKLLGTKNNVLFINDRDFALPGLIDEEIVNAVLSCKCTVALVSRRFLESSWAHFEVCFSWVQKRPIALVFLEDIKENELHGIMKYLYNKKVRLLWPRSDQDETGHECWANLIRGLAKIFNKNQARKKE